MISVVVCSNSDAFFSSLCKSVDDTIGVAHEIIRMTRQTSIFHAYNEGQKKAKYDLVVFAHEDVIFHTAGWGHVLIKYFGKMPQLGCIGIAGAPFKTVAPSGWWGVDKEFCVTYLIQRTNGQNPITVIDGWNDGTTVKEMCVIDGVFMAVKKSNDLNFDGSFTGFHCYDLNVGIECKMKNLKLVVTREIQIEHFSQGKADRNWVLNTHKMHRKYKHLFPIEVGGNHTTVETEIQNYRLFIKDCKKFKLFGLAIYYYLLSVKPRVIRRLRKLKAASLPVRKRNLSQT